MTAQYSNLNITTGAAAAPSAPAAPTPVAPTSAADAYAAKAGAALSVSAAQGVLANDADHNGQSLTAALAANGGPAHGTLVLNADGSFTYTPNAGYAGTDSFTYIASDSLSTGTPTKVTLNVAAGTPVTQAASYAVQAGQILAENAAHGVLAGDADTNGLSLTASLATNGGPAHGTLALNADGSFTYTPNAGFAGTDSFTYIASDRLSAGVPTKVTLTVGAAAATTAADAYSTVAGSALNVAAIQGVLANDVDNNGLALAAKLAAAPTHGTLTLDANGSFSYTPNAGFSGTDSFTYIASDSLSAGAPTTVTLTVSGAGVSSTSSSVGLGGSSSSTGAPAPTVIGGHGNDVYVVTNSAETIVVAAGTPNETVVASVSYALPANIQNLVLKGSGLTGAANAMNDTLTSTGGANTLVGGAGNDTFYVNNTGDKVVVAAVHGNDLIVSSVSYALPNNVRSIQLTGTGLTAHANASGGDFLSSVGGGNTLVGSAKGNDTFTVAHSTDVVVVAAGAVNDTVDTYVSFLLPANVQNLVGKGSSAITLAGNGLANVITANSGADMLTGGGGADTFVMAPGQKAETITDFNASDRIDITAYLAKSLNPTFQDFGTYSTVSFSTGETIKLLGVHASDLSLSGHYIV
jgi:VCBS repeat-containing protein